MAVGKFFIFYFCNISIVGVVDLRPEITSLKRALTFPHDYMTLWCLTFVHKHRPHPFIVLYGLNTKTTKIPKQMHLGHMGDGRGTGREKRGD